jgi:hypothetical protein
MGATFRKLQGLRQQYGPWRPLLKDPIALFSAGWLADNFPLDVVVLIRHPAAFASSLKHLGWVFPFGDLLAQTELMRDWLWPFEEDIRRFSAVEHGIIDQASLLWRISHYVIRHFQHVRPDWTFVRHEDLSREPVAGFERLFDRLDLTMTEAVYRTILACTSPDNPRDSDPGVVHQLQRHSRANVWSWRKRLSADEVRQIRNATEDIARHFYSDADWGPAPPSVLERAA